MTKKKNVSLIILDGFGLREDGEGNAVQMASTPYIDSLLINYPNMKIGASGLHVGLPDGQMGNSEVGHLNLGAGRIVYQDLTRIDKSIADGDFFTNPVLLAAIKHAQDQGKKVHLMGLLSDGGVHSHQDHLYALLELAKNQGLNDVYVHAFLDGRDTAPNSGKGYLQALLDKMQEIGVGQLATVTGRYYAMDRDNRWDRVSRAYRAMTHGEGNPSTDIIQTMADNYANELYDEFILPTIMVQADDDKSDDKSSGHKSFGPESSDFEYIPVSTIDEGDAIIFFNFRPDRAIQLTRVFIDPAFDQFDRAAYLNPHFVSMTEYSQVLDCHVAFATIDLTNTLGEVLANNNLKQLRIAETEKFKHVTSFFSGAREDEFPAETRVLIDSPRVATYDLQPEMSAYLVTDRAIAEIESGQHDVMILNFANADMVGHTGKLPAAIGAIEALDKCLARLIPAIQSVGGIALITADHGNAEQMYRPDGGAMTAHTTNPVPFIVIAQEINGQPVELAEDGILADIAPTILALLGIDRPAEMTGTSLIKL